MSTIIDIDTEDITYDNLTVVALVLDDYLPTGWLGTQTKLVNWPTPPKRNDHSAIIEYAYDNGLINAEQVDQLVRVFL